MSMFRTGPFERQRLGSTWQPFCPISAAESMLHIDLEPLAKAGKRLVLMDVDNTLLPWRSEQLTEEAAAWVRGGKALGFDFCLISNTRDRDRLKRLADQLDVHYMLGKFKPSRQMFFRALEQFNVEPGAAVMIGDQLVTDVYGANRAGIDAIWVKRLGDLELFTTRINRLVERLISKRLYQSMDSSSDWGGPVLLKRPIVRQFLKFCVVGATSFIIDAGLHRILMFHATWDGRTLPQIFGGWALEQLGRPPDVKGAHDLAASAFKVLTAGLAILNSFIWNRRWTFGIRGPEGRMRQLSKFVVVSVLGLGINVAVFTAVNTATSGSERYRWLVATVLATAVVAVWNFSGQRLWALRDKRPRK